MRPVNSNRRIPRGAAFGALTAVLAAACTVGPDFVRPTPQTPPHWSARATAPPAPVPSAVSEQAADLSAWWSGFKDPKLDSLIERACKSNLDLRAAMLRIDEARAQRAISASAFWPTLSVDALYDRERFSETTPQGALFNTVGTVHAPGSPGLTIPNPYNQLQLSGTASWEIDLFGRVRRSVEASQAGVQVSIEDQRAVLVSVLSDVAQNYIELRGAQARLRIAQENLATIDELLDLTRQRRAAGLTTHIDVSNALAQADATRAQLPGFAMQITLSINQLSELLGREPEALRIELDPAAAVPSVPAEVSIGLPSELARRRPDIREAEANLHAATAQIGVAVADLYPPLDARREAAAFSPRTPAICSRGPAASVPSGPRSTCRSSIGGAGRR